MPDKPKADGPALPRGALKAATAAIIDRLNQHAPGESAEKLARAALEAALPLAERAVLKRAAQQILLLEALANGWACPACHGKPASVPHYLEGRTGYRCGCGREWEPVPLEERPVSMEAGRLVRNLAHGKPLPPLPPKEAPGA